MANGYFRLVNDGEGFGLQIIAPTDGGTVVTMSEVMDYLTHRNLFCNFAALKNAVLAEKDVLIHMGEGACPVENMSYNLSMSDDYMTATARFYAPSETGEKLSVQEFMNDLKIRQIQFGIQEETIWKAFEKEEYCTDVIVAKGKPPVHGSDAEIEYFFNTDTRVRPTVREDGSVDFFHLNTLNLCKAGDVLAKLKPADPGRYGTNIQGMRLKPRDVKNLKLKYGNNIDRSEDKTTLTSRVNGHVMLIEDRVFVSDVLQIENVDVSTGNLDYEGSVTITGNVQANFSVKSGGNIVVNGLVEGAYLEAAGDIIIANGMVGMNKGELHAGNNIVAKFIENAMVVADGDVTAESILHCDVKAGGDVHIEGRRGFIAGGRVCATKLVDVKTLGSTLGTATTIEVGALPEVKERYHATQKQVVELSKVMKELDPVIANYMQKKKNGAKLRPDQEKYLADCLKVREVKQQELLLAAKELTKMQQNLEQQQHAQVIVRGEVFAGARIVIGDVSMAVQNSMKFCKFVKQDGDVKMVAI